MASERDELKEEFRDRSARRDFADDYVNTVIALQIKALRQQREWTQQDLAQRCGKKQSQISQYENVNNEAWTVKTLLSLAEAFDLPLVVRFESWGFLVDDSCNLGRGHLERPTFDSDPEFQEPERSADLRLIDARNKTLRSRVVPPKPVIRGGGRPYLTVDDRSEGSNDPLPPLRRAGGRG